MNAPFALRRRPTVPAEQDAIDARYATLAREERLLPVKVTPFYRRKIEAEVAALGHVDGPLHRGAYPSAERLAVRAPGEVRDWVDDRDNMPAASSGAIVRKYPDRVLFMPTSTCAGHCQYCFRQDVLSDWHAKGAEALDAAVAELLAYLDGRPEVREVILSGGDPMTLPTPLLARVLEPLHAHPRITRLRIHTRTIAFAPSAFASGDKLELLARTGVRLVFHLVHPYEVCDAVRDAIRRVRAAGVRCYNQFPLLRRVNDHPELLARHVEALDELEVRTLSMFVPEPITGSAAFRLSFDRLERLHDAFCRTTPSWIHAVRLVLDTPIGKVRREDVVGRDRAAGTIAFARDGRTVTYPDLPAELDEPGELGTLLWRG